MEIQDFRPGRIIFTRAFVAGLVFLASATLLAGSAQATVWYVAPDGDDGNDGSAAAPWATVGHAVATAGTGDTIELADGTYTEPGDNVVELIGKSLTIRSTSGDRDACVTTCWFKTVEGSGDDLVAFQDLTLSEVGAEVIDGGMGGPWAVPTSVNIDNCVVTTGLYPRVSDWNVRNSWLVGCEVGLFAENISGSGPGALAVEDCLFENCGVGINYSAFDLDYAVVGCTFRNNGSGVSADWFGKAPGSPDNLPTAYLPTSIRDFIDCVFEDNDLGAEVSTYVRFLRCEFVGNDLGLSAFADGLPAIVDCDIHDNHGDGIRLRYTTFSPSVTASRIHDNTGAGIDCEGFYDGYEITDCEVYGNTGTGVRLVDPGGYSDPGATTRLLTGCTVAGNGRGVELVLDGNVEVANTIVAFNTGEGAHAVRTTWLNCCIYGNGTDLEPDGFVPGVDFNISQDPYFCDLAGGDLDLATNSPCRHRPGYEQIGARGTKCDPVLDATVAVDVVPDEVGAAWELSGPDGFTASGVGDAVFYQVDPGEYTVTWHPVDGWESPSPVTVTRTVKPYLTKSFRGFYSPYAADDDVAVKRFGLVPNEPNPFNPATMIRFALEVPAPVDVTIYDLKGRRVRTLAADQVFGAGPQSLRWDGADERGRTAAAGIYLVQLRAGRRVDTQRIALVK